METNLIIALQTKIPAASLSGEAKGQFLSPLKR